ncbi:G4 quadruplex nucleic acid binding protein [Coemansia interrupta]|uniref:G4 quadruplex nucleic acid binding protein n=1 Tax=Coemansia interrupta TaxID=1126814 RepID=A0A9W8LK97_9FUNG|nr:G4 quadruplex nucleic acid binding protein [Coemansia interrupta]
MRSIPYRHAGPRILAQQYRNESTLAGNETAAAAAAAEVDPFDKVDLRVGVIERVSRHEAADSLYVLSINLGEKQDEAAVPRTVVSGLVSYYSQEQLTGKRVVMLANMKPRKLRGITSQGMLLAASSAGANGDISVEVIEACMAARAGDPVTLLGSKYLTEPLGKKTPVKRQRIIDAFIDGLSLDSRMVFYRGKQLMAGSEAIATQSLRTGVIG